MHHHREIENLRFYGSRLRKGYRRRMVEEAVAAFDELNQAYLDRWAAEASADMDACVTEEVRRAAKFVLGCNYAFVDDDIRQISALAIRALRAGLTEGIHPDTMQEIEKRRAVDWSD